MVGPQQAFSELTSRVPQVHLKDMRGEKRLHSSQLPQVQGRKHSATLRPLTRRAQAAESRVLARLHSLLQRMPPLERRAVLEARLAESQRQVLEKWMMTNRNCSTSKEQSKAPAFLGEKELCMCKYASSNKMDSLELRSSRESSDSDFRKVSSTASKSSAAGLGVMTNRQKGGCFYSAQVSVGILRLMSKADRNFSTVLAFRDVLLTIRQRVVDATGAVGSCFDKSFETIFRRAVREALAETTLDPLSMGLRFKVCLRPLWVSKPLCTPAYSLVGQMDEGLQALRRLSNARGRAASNSSHVLRTRPLLEVTEEWRSLREAYVDTMVDAGRSRTSIAAKLDLLQSEFQMHQDRQMRGLLRVGAVAAAKKQPCLDRKNARSVQCAEKAERALDIVLRRWSKLWVQDQHHKFAKGSFAGA